MFPTQGSDLGLLLCRQILNCLSHQGSDGITVRYLNKTGIVQAHETRTNTFFLQEEQFSISPEGVRSKPQRQKLDEDINCRKMGKLY